MAGLDNLKKDLAALENSQKAQIYARFFKTGKGEYGQGDQFLGIVVPKQRIIARRYKSLSLADLRKLLLDKYHECRSIALMILIDKYKKAKEDEKKEIVNFYLLNSKKINNWDLVDLSAPNILGDWFLERNKDALYKFAKSENLWQRRIAIMATFGFIRKDKYQDALRISEILLSDKHDLIHKAVGWMLREVGKKDLKAQEGFLSKHYQKMPRTMLRYAIEKMSQEKRKFYLGN